MSDLVPTKNQAACLRAYAWDDTKEFSRMKAQHFTEAACVRRGWLARNTEPPPARAFTVTEAGRFVMRAA